MPAGDRALAKAFAEMDRRAAELVALWRRADAAKGVAFIPPAWPGRVHKPEPADYWAAGKTRGN